MSKKRIMVDFDRVIHKYSKGWNGGTIYDEPVEGALEALQILRRSFDVVIFTARSERGTIRNEEIEAWLANHNVTDIEVTNTKLPAMAYIDDRGLRFTNWSDMLRYFI